MSEVEELEMRIRNLPSEDQVRLRNWFYEFDNELWDREIEATSRPESSINLLIRRGKNSPKARRVSFETLHLLELLGALRKTPLEDSRTG